jgi:hypothetical protein
MMDKRIGAHPSESKPLTLAVTVLVDFYSSSFALLLLHEAIILLVQRHKMMSSQIPEDEILFEVIPDGLRTPEQVAHWRGGHKTPTYRLRREPRNLYELELYGPRTAVWMDNETLVHVSRGDNYPNSDNIDRRLHLLFILYNPRRNTRVVISGKKDEAIAETAMYWWGLHCPEECAPRVSITNQSNTFDFAAVKTRHLATIFENNQNRRVEFNGVHMNSAQLAFLASRNHPIDLAFEFLNVLEDGGNALVQALQVRGAHFGSLRFLDDLPLSDENVEQVSRLAIFRKLTLPLWESDMVLLPFSAPVKVLKYSFDSSKVRPEDFQTIDILSEELIATIWVDEWNDGSEVTVSLLRRLASIGHFRHLGVKFEGRGHSAVEPKHSKIILEELVRATAANKELVSLDLEMYYIFQQSHLTELLESFDDHKGLRTITIEVHSDNSDCSWLKHLLSRNRRIEIRGEWMESVMNRDELNELYTFNRFYTGSETLEESPHSFRTKLIGITLSESAFGDFKRTAFLLTSYIDSLYELIQSANLDSLAASDQSVDEESNVAYDSTGRISRPKRSRTD